MPTASRQIRHEMQEIYDLYSEEWAPRGRPGVLEAHENVGFIAAEIFLSSFRVCAADEK